MPRSGYSTAVRNPPRARRKYTKAVDETIRRARAGDDGTHAGNSQSNSAAVLRSVSAEAGARCDRRQRGPYQREVLARKTNFICLVEFCRELKVRNFHGRFLRSEKISLQSRATL